MKSKNSISSFTFIGFIIFFITILVSSTLSIFVYYLSGLKSNGNTYIVILSVIGIILFCAIVFTLCDMFRRKIMIEKPVKKILDATKEIASGNFNTKLVHEHDFSSYDQYDLIFDNINTMTEELSKNEVLKNDFISNVSHEIKTPLAIIQNYANALKNQKLTENKKQEYLNTIVIQTKKMSTLISNILKLNKLENQSLTIDKKPFDLAECIRLSIISFESLIEQKNLNLDCDIEESTIQSSQELIEIIINNLISNAIKFTPNNGNIFISLKNRENQIQIKIQDTGSGISKEIGEHIFEKFYQGDKTRSSEGNGLGLSLVKKVIDIIGGKINVESKVNIGSTFTITLNKE